MTCAARTRMVPRQRRPAEDAPLTVAGLTAFVQRLVNRSAIAVMRILPRNQIALIGCLGQALHTAGTADPQVGPARLLEG